HALEWVERDDGKIAAEGKRRATVEQRAECVTRLAPLLANCCLGVPTVIGLVERLHGGDDAYLCKSSDVTGQEMLDMFNSVRRHRPFTNRINGRTHRGKSRRNVLVNIEHVVIGGVADGVDRASEKSGPRCGTQ